MLARAKDLQSSVHPAKTRHIQEVADSLPKQSPGQNECLSHLTISQPIKPITSKLKELFHGLHIFEKFRLNFSSPSFGIGVVNLLHLNCLSYLSLFLYGLLFSICPS